MSLIPPTGTELGFLQIEEVYFEYEGPKFFSALSATGTRYLAVAVAEDEGEETETYLYVAVSDARFESVRSGGIGVRQAFVEPEDGFLFQVVVDYDANKSSVQAVTPDSLTDAELPTSTARIEIPTESRPHFEPGSLVSQANGLNRTLLALELEPADPSRTELSLRSLSRLTGSIQEMLDALGQEVTGRATQRGLIPSEITQATEMVFRESLAASFVIVLAESAEKDDSEAGSPAILADACERLSELIARAQTGSEFRDLLASYGARARTKYRAFMEGLSDEGTGVELFIAQPGRTLSHAKLEQERLRESLAVIRETGLEVMREDIDRAFFVGVNIRTRSFEIVNYDTNERYSGYMEPRVRAQAAGITVGPDHVYSVTLLVQKWYSNVTGAARDTFRLEGIGAGATSTPLRRLHEAVTDDSV